VVDSLYELPYVSEAILVMERNDLHGEKEKKNNYEIKIGKRKRI